MATPRKPPNLLRTPKKKGRKSTPKNSTTSPRSIRKAERKAKALELRIIGYSYATIGKEMKMDPAEVFRLVDEALTEMVQEPADRLRQIELTRLDEMQASAFPQACEGIEGAQNQVLRLMERRARYVQVEIAPLGRESNGVHVQVNGGNGVMALNAPPSLTIEFVQPGAPALPAPAEASGKVIEHEPVNGETSGETEKA
jgi:hypothetical protein